MENGGIAIFGHEERAYDCGVEGPDSSWGDLREERERGRRLGMRKDSQSFQSITKPYDVRTVNYDRRDRDLT